MARVRKYTEFISTLLTKEIRNKLIKITDDKIVSVSEYVRKCVEKSLQDE